MPITKLTLDNLTLEEYLELLRQRGRSHEADELSVSIPQALEVESLEAIAKITWGEIQASLEGKIQEIKSNIASVVPMGLLQGDEEVFIGGALPSEKALKIMREQDTDWLAFKMQTRSA